MLRVLHVAETIKGGVATVISSLLNTKYTNYSVVPEDQVSCLEEGSNNIYGYVGSKRGLYLIFSMCLKVLCVARDVKPDVVHLHSSFALLCAPVIFFLSRKSKIVYQPHGVYYDPNVSRSVIKLIAVRYFEKLLAIFVDEIIAISEYEFSIIKTVHGDSKVVLLVNSVSPSRIEFDNERPRSGYLFVGRLDEQKGIDKLLSFWSKEMPQEVLNVIGASVRSKFDFISPANVCFHGWVDSSLLDTFYASSKAVIVPSRWEGFGLVVVEAYRNGTPVIVSNRGALPELVEQGLSGFVFDFDDFENALGTSLKDLSSITDRRSINEFCHSKYLESYSLPGYIDKYEKLIDGLCNV